MERETSIRSTLAFARALLGINIKASFALRGAFWMQAGFMAANNLLYFTFWWIFFDRFEEIRGWRLNDVAALFGIAAAAYGIAVVFAGGVRDLARQIIDGEIEAQLEDGTSFQAGLGYPVGNLESLAHQPRWYRPVARTDVVALRADHETFFDVMEDDFEVAEAFLKAMSHGILAAQNAFVARGEKYPRPGQA